MIIFAVLVGLALLVGSALVWGTDSRDGHDWAPGIRAPGIRAPGIHPADAERSRPASPLSRLWAHHEG